MHVERPARAAVRLGLRHHGVRRLVASELAMRRAGTPSAMVAGQPRVFVDSHGVADPLEPGRRDHLTYASAGLGDVLAPFVSVVARRPVAT